ncbi:MAG: hypothetical protein HOQ32_12850, partial [Lysobacter sp.]|nr:hypothetical protein [Lysobacter sp.]
APAIEVAAAGTATAANPFRPQHSEPASRPWPRAVLPDYPATGGFTASYGSSSTSASSTSASARSFYPFEPRATEPVQTPPARESETRMPQP